ncbi:hypothetical protein [Polyangium jinanense]|uniref:Uncharacterized protein n=1 Tax=Polyangium jinanense TaxID=2829994 RepID=A0A9X3XGV6_9BACT|nr:hypothetical protein [Polyangium jinanense]MDC3961372.1 hypothetical protein [Polyangium jinanense]MDC3987751.1 hypothetical protein [Polyangium jinanense]
MRDEASAPAQDVVRALPPLDTDMRAFFAFFGAFSEAPEPLAFLADRGLAEGDLFHLLGLWQARMSADRALQKDALGLLARPTGEIPDVQVGPALPVQAPGDASAPGKVLLAATSLGFLVDRPALPFVAPPADAPPPAFPPRLPRPAPKGLGETSMALHLDKPVLPFAKKPAAAAPEAVPPKPLKGPAPPSLGETRTAVHLYKPALPFAAKALAQTALTFQVNPRVLPFGSEPPPPPRPLGDTAPAFPSAKPVMPFPAADKPPVAPPAPRPAPSLLAETSLALPINLSAVLPFVKPTPSAPATRLSIEAYATMCAEIWLDPPGALRIIARYGLSPEAKRAEDAAWQARFAAEPATRATWERLSIEAGARIRAGR